MIKLPHVLKDNKSNKMPARVIFFDTETREVKTQGRESEQRLFLGEALYWRRREPVEPDTFEWLEFKAAAEFWTWVVSKVHKGERLFLVAHNISFDFKVLAGFGWFRSNKWEVKKVIINGTTNIWEFGKDRQSVVILDNMNYFKGRLAELGDDLGIPKLPMPAPDADIEQWQRYCRRDVEVMLKAWQVWIKFLVEQDLGCFAKTLPSQSLNAFRHRFMDTKIYIHAFDRITELERAAYHGGRTEAFFIGQLPKGNYYYVDVNSMYPAVMSEHEYPVKVAGHFRNPQLNWLKANINRYCFVADCEVETQEPAYSLVFKGRLVYPTGRFRTTLSTREIQYALSQGHILSVGNLAFYEKAKVFKPYVEFFYNARLKYRAEGNQSFAYLCKLMLNSLYGKFGQRNEVYEPVGMDDSKPDGIVKELDYQSGEWVTYRIINGRVEKLAGMKEGYNSFPAIAAHITADARMKLYEYIRKAGRSEVFYCDTDSLFVSDTGFSRLSADIVKGVLGKLSVVKTTTDLVIYGAKDYVFGGEAVIKGIRKDAVKLDAVTFDQVKFEGLRGSIQKGRLNSMVTSIIRKRLKREYKKGYVSDRGFVVPFALNQHDGNR